MPVIEPRNPSVRDMRGIHLWHDDMSSCSQRVRAVLAEKDQPWQSHLIEIPKGENTTADYLSINPKGLVPALVHDGVLMIESIDIIDYLDRAFPEPPLRPSQPDAVREMERWMKLADGAQYDLKVLSHEFLFRAVRTVSDAEMQNFEANVDNGVLIDFLHVYREGDRLPVAMVTESVDRTHSWFSELDAALATQDWLAGDTLSLADISWMPNVHRMELMNWPFERYPHLQRWHARVRQSKAYGEGIVAWEPPPARALLTAFASSRGKGGYAVRDFGRLRVSA